MFRKLGAAVAAITLSFAGSASAAVVVQTAHWQPFFSCVPKACQLGTEIDFTPQSWTYDPANLASTFHSRVYGWMDSLTFDVFEISNATPFTNVRFKSSGWGTPASHREEVIGVTDENGYFRIEGLAFKGNALLTVGYKRYDLFIDASGIAGGIPEPSTWAMMIAGFGLAGSALRRRRLQAA